MQVLKELKLVQENLQKETKQHKKTYFRSKKKCSESRYIFLNKIRNNHYFLGNVIFCYFMLSKK